MRTLLFIAHGSRDPEANCRVEELAGELARELGPDFDRVHPAFLEFADPDGDAAIAACVAGGAREVVVLPYFLAPGRHVTRDVPALLARAREAHPGTTFRLLPHAGSAPHLAEALADLGRQALRETTDAAEAGT